MWKFLKNHWILVVSLLLLVLMALPLLYFGNLLKMLDSSAENRGGLPATGPGRTIGICLNDLIDSRWMSEKDIWLREARLNKVSVRIKAAHHSLTRQIRQIRSLIREKAKALIIVPVSQDGLTEVLQEAAQKNIKIILYDELTNGPADLYCGIDYRQMGRLQASYLAKTVGRGYYLVLKGPADSYKADRIARGQIETLQSLSHRDVRLLTGELSPRWSAEEAVLKTRSVATRQKIKAVLVPNDMIAEEIIKSFKAQNLDLPAIGGIGGELNVLHRIESGEPLVTVTSDYDRLAQIAFHSALKLSSGERLPDTSIITYNSNKIPSVFISVLAINRYNVAQQIEKQYEFLKE